MANRSVVQNCNQLLVGYPETGKTTFLAALNYSVGSQGQNSLVLAELDRDTEYLNAITEKWLRCEQEVRTTVAGHHTTRMKLRDRTTLENTYVVVPDMSGEVFDHQFEERRWSKEFGELVASCDGVMLFIHPSKVVRPLSILEVDQVLGTTGAEAEVATDSGPEPSERWSAAKAPTQVKLVDLLQFILDRASTGASIPLVILISAWDEVKKQMMVTNSDILPSKWINQNLPLLYQYITSNPNRFQHRVFGISAQGGDYSSDMSRLLTADPVESRIEVLSESGSSNDISAPVKWIIDQSRQNKANR